MSTKHTSFSLIKTALLKAVVDKSLQSYYGAVLAILHCGVLTPPYRSKEMIMFTLTDLSKHSHTHTLELVAYVQT